MKEKPIKEEVSVLSEILRDSANRIDGILEFLKHVPDGGSNNQDDKDRVRYQIEAELRDLENTKKRMGDVVARLQEKKTKL